MVCLIPSNFPCVQAALLEYMPEYEPLYTALNIPALSEAELLAGFLLPAFGQLGSGLQERVTSRVLQQWPSWKGNVALLAALADAPFVLAGEACQYHPEALQGHMHGCCLRGAGSSTMQGSESGHQTALQVPEFALLNIRAQLNRCYAGHGALLEVFSAFAADGQRQHARSLYSPAVPLLAAVFRERPSVLPAAHFSTPTWLQVKHRS